MKNFFITPSRLKKPNFYKSLQMLKTINPHVSIVMPRIHQRWFHYDGWTSISVENVYMCLEYQTYYSGVRWRVEGHESHNLFNFLLGKINLTENLTAKEIDVVNVVKEALSLPFVTSEMLIPLIKEKLSKISTFESYVEFFNNIYKNKNITPQIINLLVEISSNFILNTENEKRLNHILISYNLTIIPNLIFENLLTASLAEAIKYDEGDFYREAFRRGLLKREVAYIPKTIVVKY